MNEEHFPKANWLPILAGLSWLLSLGGEGIPSFLLAVLPGSLLLAGGVSTFLLPGDLRTQQISALGGAVGVVLAVPAILAAGFGTALLLLLLSAASFVAAGWIAHQREPEYEDVPEAENSLRLAAKVAVDEAILGTMLLSGMQLDRAERHAAVEELARAEKLFAERGWLDKPASYHVEPPELRDPELAPARARKVDFEHMRFESGYVPDPEVPGRERWLEYSDNRTAHAWVVRHQGEPRPWLMCVHGYGMGMPGIDFGAFQPNFLHGELGLNLVFPILPLHGPRKIGRRSGREFVGGYYMNTLHAESQAMWDLRRILSWVRGQGAPRVGVYGLSLGGYTTALLSCLDGDLDCVIPGIPATDFVRIGRRYSTPMLLREAEAIGLSWEDIEKVFRIVSPLALEPKVPHERRYIFGGTADRLVPADQVRDLWLHWQKPRIAWYAGSHMSFGWEPEVKGLLRDALRDRLLRD
jgi:hypothetical protein